MIDRSFGDSTRRELLLRRLMIGLRIPPAALRPLGRLIPDLDRRRVWAEFVERLAYWCDVRRASTRETWVRLTHGVPVLMYHAFGDPPGRYILRPRAFAAQMRLLSLLRYRVISLEELAATLRAHDLPPKRAAVITIDDGYEDNLKFAYPILARHGHRATIYLVSERIGARNDWARGEARDRALLTLEQIRSMSGGPVGFGAHTRTHPHLEQTADDQLTAEIGGSRSDLEAQLGTPINTFAYPYGEYDGRALAAVRDAGFTAAATTEPRLVRPTDDPLRIPRVEIFGTDSLRQFAIKLLLGIE